MFHILFRIFIIVILLVPTKSFAADADSFMSLRADEVFMRYGPSTDHPIKWVYHQKGWPMKIVLRFDQWVKVMDVSGEVGWIHNSLLSTKKRGIAQAMDEKSYVVLKKSNKKDSSGVLRIEEGTLLKVYGCEEGLCKVGASGYKGYLEKKLLWGIVQTQ